MLNFNIEKNIPIPKPQHGKKKKSKYGFHKLELEAGDSVLFTDYKIAKASLNYFNKYSEKNSTGQKYSMRQLNDNEWRLWRVK